MSSSFYWRRKYSKDVNWNVRRLRSAAAGYGRGKSWDGLGMYVDSLPDKLFKINS